MTKEDLTNLKSYFDLVIQNLKGKGYNPLCFDMMAKEINYLGESYGPNDNGRFFCYICFEKSKLWLLNDGFHIPEGFDLEENSDDNIPYSTCIKRFYDKTDYEDIFDAISSIDIAGMKMSQARGY